MKNKQNHDSYALLINNLVQWFHCNSFVCKQCRLTLSTESFNFKSQEITETYINANSSRMISNTVVKS